MIKTLYGRMTKIFEYVNKFLKNSELKSEIDESEKEYHILGSCPESLFNCENCEEIF